MSVQMEVKVAGVQVDQILQQEKSSQILLGIIFFHQLWILMQKKLLSPLKKCTG